MLLYKEMGSEVSNREEYCTRVGPWGTSLSGKCWTYMPSNGTNTHIVIAYGEVIDSIKFLHSSLCQRSEKYGGPGGNRVHTIQIEDPTKEYLTLIRGSYGSFRGESVIRSLAFHTNLHQHGLYGSSDQGIPFPFGMENGSMVGFHGRAGTYLETIGVYAKPRCYLYELTGQFEVMKSVVPRGPGPWGGSGGRQWDDGVFKNIKEVIVHIGTSSNVVQAIEFEYEQDNWKSSWSPLYGCSRGNNIIKKVNLDCEGGEFMVGIAGYYGLIEGVEAITSITFYTNKDQYGPYGKERGSNYTYFASSASPGKVVGFHGRSDDYLTAIGVHMQYF